MILQRKRASFKGCLVHLAWAWNVPDVDNDQFKGPHVPLRDGTCLHVRLGNWLAPAIFKRKAQTLDR